MILLLACAVGPLAFAGLAWCIVTHRRRLPDELPPAVSIEDDVRALEGLQLRAWWSEFKQRHPELLAEAREALWRAPRPTLLEGEYFAAYEEKHALATLEQWAKDGSKNAVAWITRGGPWWMS